MKSIFAVIFCVSVVIVESGFAQELNYPQAKVSFSDFKELVAEVESHRANRLIDLNMFLEMSREPNTIILDTRSDFRFDRVHISGAKHLAFTDFTQQNLSNLIPDPNTRILIYCNNNFEGNKIDFAPKAFLPISKSGDMASQIATQEKPRLLALNIPTYINLYGYGYRNVYELHELVNINDPRVQFGGSTTVANDISNQTQLTK